MPRRHAILSRHRIRPFEDTSQHDFTLGPGRAVDLGVLADPLWSLYSLDLDTDSAVFVLLAPDTDLSSAPFIPIAQFQAATEILVLPLNDLPRAAATPPQPAKRIFLFSIGRCGTTLAHHILNAVPGVLALSEPHPFMTLALARHQMSAARAESLIAAATRLMFRPPSHGPQSSRPATTLTIKLHSQALFQAALYHRAFPDAKFLFQYRDAPGWANSFSRFLQNLDAPIDLAPADLAAIWSILAANTPLADLGLWTDPDARNTRHAALLAAGWALYMATAQDLLARGLPFHKLHYDDLNTRRDASVRAMLVHCGLPTTAMQAALAAFDHDSQEGTAIARGGATQGFTPEDRDLLLATLAKGPAPLPPDLRL